ncbi:MAG: PKD domain-containing protein [Chloroflexota bacterium]
MKTSKILYIVFIVVLSGVSMASVLYARPYGRTGRSGKQEITCSACHFGGVAPELTLDGPNSVAPGETVDFVFTVDKNSDNVETTTAGFNLAVSAGLITGRGESPEACTDLVEPDNNNRTCINEEGGLNEIAQARPTLLENGKAAYEFSWTAPLTATGDIIFYGAGVAAKSGAGAFNFDVHAASQTFTITVEGELGPQAPTALVSADPITGTAPLEVTLDGSSSFDSDGSIVSYRWTLNNVEIGNTAVITQLFESEGSYTVELEVSDNDQQVATNSVTIIVGPTGPQVPNATISSAFDLSDQEGLTVEFDASQSTDLNNDIVRYVWSFGDGNFAEGVKVTHRYEVEGNYNVMLEVTDSQGQRSLAERTLAVGPDALSAKVFLPLIVR